MSYITDMEKAIDYIEENLEENINYEKVAKQVGMSSYYFHRIFSFTVGISPSEYTRNRRLTKAGEELTKNKSNILDIAIKYGFESNEAFTRAFKKFHGILPKDAKQNGNKLNAYSKIKLELKVDGGNILNYRIEERDAFDVCLILRDFCIENKYEISKFWEEIRQNGKLEDISQNFKKDLLGVCIGEPESTKYKYGIGIEIKENKNILEDTQIIHIDKSKWIIFTCQGQKAENINNLWSKIYKEFFITSEYKQCMDIDFELYNNENTEIWIPISK